jgi:hypothetical protein
MMDENGPFVAFSDIFFKYFSSSHSFTQCTVRDFQYHFTGMHTRHCVALSVIIPPPTNFRRQKKNKRKTRKPVTRVWVGFLQDCHLRCAVQASHKREWIESDWYTAVVVLIAHIRRPQSPA